jgi:anti-sigma factor RsiW
LGPADQTELLLEARHLRPLEADLPVAGRRRLSPALSIPAKPVAKIAAAGVVLAGLLLLPWPCRGETGQQVDPAALFAAAERDGRVGLARKAKMVDVRAAKPGEIIVTVIKGAPPEALGP